MSTATIPRRDYSLDEYLQLERAGETKHQFYRGEIFAMAGASAPHNLIVGNLVTRLNNRLEAADCLVFPSDMRVKCPTGLVTYPDVSAVCERPEYHDEKADTLLNPLLIIEVLSPSTEAYDRGRKKEHYRTIGNLCEYVLVAQDRTSIEVFRRQSDSQWLTMTLTDLGATLTLSSVDCSIPVAEVYAKVSLPAELPLPPGSEWAKS